MERTQIVGRFTTLLWTTIVACACLVAAAEAASDRVRLPGHVVDGLAQRTSLRPVAKAQHADAEPMSLTIVLRRSDPQAFEHYLAELYSVPLPLRRYPTPAEVSDRFGPSIVDYVTVRQYFVGEGFEVLSDSPNRMTISVRAPRVVVERSLDVRLKDYVVDGRAVVANTDDPALPPAIASRVQAVVGLSSLAMPTAVPGPLKQGLDATRGCIGGDIAGQGQGVNLFCAVAHAFLAFLYNFGCLSHLALDCTMVDPFPKSSDAQPKDLGAGQKIGIVAFDAFHASDVADFLALVGRPPSQINRLSLVPVNGGAPVGPDASEVLLDIGIVMMLAQNADVAVYSAPFSGAGSFQAIFNSMINSGVTVITNSWAYCENETSAADVQSIDTILATAAASGISTFNASGDAGSTCLNGSPNTVHVPANVPHAVAVGGTTMTPGPAGTYGSETWWNGTSGTPPTGQGGFGASRFFPRPAYQDGHTASATRSVPDVALSANPASIGLPICEASQGGCPSGLLYGGTSASAPTLAAMVAVMNEARGVNLGWPNPQFYVLANTNAFHNAASMGSDFAHVGLGSPNISFLHLALAGQVPGLPVAAQSIVAALDSSHPADGTSPLRIVVQLRDAKGAAVPGKTVGLNKIAGSSAVITPPSAVTSVSNGAAVFTVTNATVENVVFTATDVSDGIVLPQTVEVAFVVPPATAGGIAAFPTTVANNGVATTTITVTLQDANGNPTPGKEVMLSQGSGHSIITAPSPAVTDVSGQIQFTATNRIAETVTYTAIDVTDGNLPIPGTAVVTFSGQASVSCVTAIEAAPGYTATPIATGFVAEAFNFSNVNWACAGGSDPTFEANGDFYVASFRTGELFRMPAQGGAATNANRLSTPGMTIQRTVIGKDGKLYAVRAGTGSGFFSGQALELDRETGATVRVLASNLPCAGPPAVDPVSGDLFFTGTCFGAGSDDARLLRIVDPGGPSPTLVSYATLPGTPNGAVAFSPDGTIFVAVTYLAPNAPIVRISGTNQPQPPTITPLDVHGVFWVNVGETLPDGSAKSLIVNTSDDKLKLVDITTVPPTSTEILTTGASSGVIGPDRCLYLSDRETVYRITRSDGSCGFATTAAAPAIGLTPANVAPNPAQGDTVEIIAQLIGLPPMADIPILFSIQGANEQPRLVRTDATGKATLTYLGAFAGNDAITATATVGGSTLESNTARVTWLAGTHTTSLTVNLSPEGSIVGTPVTLSATLTDLSLAPQAGIAGVTLQFNVGGQACNAVTNAGGTASCAVTIPLTGQYTLSVSFAGNASYLAASTVTGFDVLPPGPPPCFAFNDIDSTSQFCPNVDWMKNRAVTLGCTTRLYCPIDAVSRLQMAAFMNRLGTTLTGVVLTQQQQGALDLDAEPVVCQTDEFETGAYPRLAVVDASFSGRSDSDTGFAADAVASFDGGMTWVPLASVGNRGFAQASHWGHVRAHGTADLAADDAVRFGLSITRGGLPPGADLSDSRCTLRVRINNR